MKLDDDLREYKMIAKAYGVEVLPYDESTGGPHTDGGACCGDTIWIYPSDKQWVKELSFWHELGHILSSRYHAERGITTSMSYISKEGCAWEMGLAEASKHGKKWDHYSEQMNWARKCLASYVHGEYDDLVCQEK